MNPLNNPLAPICLDLHEGIRECARLVKAFEEFSSEERAHGPGLGRSFRLNRDPAVLSSDSISGGVGVAASPDVGPWAPPDSGEESMKPSEEDGRDWDAELRDDENPRQDVQRLRRLRRRSMAMRMEMRPQLEREPQDG